MTNPRSGAGRRPGGILLIALVASAVSWWVWEPNVSEPVAVTLTVASFSFVLVLGCAASVAVGHSAEVDAPTPPDNGLTLYRSLVARGIPARVAARAIVGDPRYLDMLLADRRLWTFDEHGYFGYLDSLVDVPRIGARDNDE